MKLVWIDFENAPHVPVLLPIVNALNLNGYETVMTARNFSFTKDLIKKHQLDVLLVGEGAKSQSTIRKGLQVFRRVFLLVRMFWKKRKFISLSIAHASRSQLIAARILGITSVSLEDYEYSNQMHNRLADYLLVPHPIPTSSFPKTRGSIIHYPGLKEDIYLGGQLLPESIPDFLCRFEDSVLILFRPEGRMAHYRSETSENLQFSLLKKLCALGHVHLLVYPRDEIQKKTIEDILLDGNATYQFPPIVLGADLIASVDLVIGGGGTMTREAAVLGVPSYSFFSGEWGAVDEYLVQNGDLVRIISEDDYVKIIIEKRRRKIRLIEKKTCDFVTRYILSILNNRAR